MGLLALFDRLVEEHGSANITRDNLAFLRDQIKVAEQANVEAGNRIGKLEGTVSQQAEQIIELTEKCERYAKQLADCQQRIQDQAEKTYRLDDAEQRTLRVFAEKQTNTLELDSNDTAVISLYSHKFLTFTRWMQYSGGPRQMRLTPKGQRAIEQLKT